MIDCTDAEEHALAEKRELMRLAAQRIIDNDASGAREADPLTKEWAHWIVRHNKPLQRPLGPGDVGA